MNTRTNPNALRRTLYVDFELYTDNDVEFKKELIDHMVDNIQELLQAYLAAVSVKSIAPFNAACHKVKTTLVMLNDSELNEIVGNLKNIPPDGEWISILSSLCAEIVASLLYEKN